MDYDERKKLIWNSMEIPFRNMCIEQGLEDPWACRDCGSEMDLFNGRKDQQYCSNACRQRAYRKRTRSCEV